MVVLTALAAVLGGCTHRGLDPSLRNEQWTLVRMELDKTLVKNRGILPVFYAPTGSGAGVPKAKGSIRINDNGRVACFVSIFEPVVGLGGTTSYLKYDAVRFFGRREDNGRLVVQEDSSAGHAPLGRTTTLHIEDVGDGTLKIHTSSNGVRLPYVYFFYEGSAASPPIHIPYVDR
ncbi:MAG: hypothetical protein CMJ83_12660 [Planctomycetes bacterium]|nr:hypothetical protein [Planctomycetota bacterium]